MSTQVADLVKVSIDEDSVTDIKGMHHKEEDDAVKHGSNSILEDEAERHNGSCHSSPEVGHIHLHRRIAQLPQEDM